MRRTRAVVSTAIIQVMLAFRKEWGVSEHFFTAAIALVYEAPEVAAQVCGARRR